MSWNVWAEFQAWIHPKVSVQENQLEDCGKRRLTNKFVSIVAQDLPVLGSTSA